MLDGIIISTAAAAWGERPTGTYETELTVFHPRVGRGIQYTRTRIIYIYIYIRRCTHRWRRKCSDSFAEMLQIQRLLLFGLRSVRSGRTAGAERTKHRSAILSIESATQHVFHRCAWFATVRSFGIRARRGNADARRRVRLRAYTDVGRRWINKNGERRRTECRGN